MSLRARTEEMRKHEEKMRAHDAKMKSYEERLRAQQSVFKNTVALDKSFLNTLDKSLPTLTTNKNLAKISNSFRKSLEPYTKRDVNKLIDIPEDDKYIDNMMEEHQERMRAHESVFSNVVIEEVPHSGYIQTPSEKAAVAAAKKKEVRRESKRETKAEVKPKKHNVKEPSSNIIRTREQNGARPRKPVMKPPTTMKMTFPPAEPKKEVKKPFTEALKSAGDGEDEVYKIIKEHMEYEMGAAAPKLTPPRKPSYTKVPQRMSRETLLIGDAAGKTILKYNESHKKLQNLVDTFQEKIGTNPQPRRQLGPPPPAPTTADEYLFPSEIVKDDDNMSRKSSFGSVFPVSAVGSSQITSETSIASRKQNAYDASSTLSRSMKTIDRASTVAQRLGTLMNRISLRNEKYDYETQIEKQKMAREAEAAPINFEDIPVEESDSEIVARVALKPSPAKTVQSIDSSTDPISPRNAIGRGNLNLPKGPGVPLSVSRMDSNQFEKYVEEMKKVAEKAAASFERYKKTQIETDFPPLTKQQAEVQVLKQPAPAPLKATQARKKKTVDSSTSARKPEIQTQTQLVPAPSVASSKVLVDEPLSEFKFVPELSYTDQIMLKNLRKLKEKEGWGDSMQAQVLQLAEAADVMIDHNDGPSPYEDQIKLAPLLKRAAALEIPNVIERPGPGAAVSLNEILRARMQKAKGTGKK